MKKIFVTGEPSVNDELKTILSAKCEFAPKLDDSIDLIVDTINFPFEKKRDSIKYIDENSGKNIPVFSSALCMAASEIASFSKYPKRIIGIGLYDTVSHSKLIEIAPSKATDIKILENAEKFLKEIELKYTIVPDKTGLVFPRILAMIINEAAQVYSENIASRGDIDTAMKLGTNYPFGPLEWADKLGIDLVYNILSSLQRDFGEDRYRPHPSLKEMINLKLLGVKSGKGFYSY